jgi:hypothetical protein
MEEAMTDTALHGQAARCKSEARPAPGTTFFGLMVAAWSTFVTLLAVSPETLADLSDWLGGLALVWEVLLWILLLPWALAYVVWEASWEQWLRVALVIVIATLHLTISTPRVRR